MSRDNRFALFAISAVVGMALTSCSSDSPTSDEALPPCALYITQLMYNVVVEDERDGGLSKDPHPESFEALQQFAGTNGRLMSFDDALTAVDPGVNKMWGRAQINEITGNYLYNREVPVDEYSDAYSAAMSYAVLTEGELYYVVAQNLPGIPPQQFVGTQSLWKPLDEVTDDANSDRNLISALTPYFAEQKVPIEAFVSTYDAQLETCAPPAQKSE